MSEHDKDKGKNLKNKKKKEIKNIQNIKKHMDDNLEDDMDMEPLDELKEIVIDVSNVGVNTLPLYRNIGTDARSVRELGDFELQSAVIKDILRPAFIKDVKNDVKWKSKWYSLSSWFESGSVLLSGIGTMFSFATIYYDNMFLTFIAGCLGVLVTVLLKFSNYARNESHERNDVLNRNLKIVGIEGMPDISADLDHEQDLEICK
jgi:hypothetical protein